MSCRIRENSPIAGGCNQKSHDFRDKTLRQSSCGKRFTALPDRAALATLILIQLRFQVILRHSRRIVFRRTKHAI